MFLCTRTLFDALETRRSRSGLGYMELSLSDGVSQLAAAGGVGKVAAVAVTGEDWIDMDTPEAFREAERRLCDASKNPPVNSHAVGFIKRFRAVQCFECCCFVRFSCRSHQ